MEKFFSDNLAKIGFTGAIIMAFGAFYSGQVYLKSQYDDVKAQMTAAQKDRDTWMKLALQGTKLSEAAAAKTGSGVVMSGPPPIFPANPTAKQLEDRLNKVRDVVAPGDGTMTVKSEIPIDLVLGRKYFQMKPYLDKFIEEIEKIENFEQGKYVVEVQLVDKDLPVTELGREAFFNKQEKRY